MRGFFGCQTYLVHLQFICWSNICAATTGFFGHFSLHFRGFWRRRSRYSWLLICYNYCCWDAVAQIGFTRTLLRSVKNAIAQGNCFIAESFVLSFYSAGQLFLTLAETWSKNRGNIQRNCADVNSFLNVIGLFQPLMNHSYYSNTPAEVGFVVMAAFY